MTMATKYLVRRPDDQTLRGVYEGPDDAICAVLSYFSRDGVEDNRDGDYNFEGFARDERELAHLRQAVNPDECRHHVTVGIERDERAFLKRA